MKLSPFRELVGRVVLAVAVAGLFAARSSAQGKTPSPQESDAETILSTYHVRAGQEQAFLAAITRTWAIYRRLDAVLPRPHVLLREVDDAGHVVYHELFTWRSADIPDHAPTEIKAAWKELESLCKRPDGHSGIEGDEVTVAAMD